MSHLSEEEFKEIRKVFFDCHRAASMSLLPAVVILKKDCKTISKLSEKVNELNSEIDKLCKRLSPNHEITLEFSAYLHILTSILMNCEITFSSEEGAEEQHPAQ